MTDRSPITADELIERLGLEPHPREGGHFVETYRSALRIPGDVLPELYEGGRDIGTAIYYLLRAGDYSEMHRLPGDEVYHFYLGDPVEMLQLHPDGTGGVIVLGPDVRAGMRPQAVVPGGVWQGSRLQPGGRYALLGATMAPGFDYADYEAGDRGALVEAYPEFAHRIELLTAGD